MNDPGRKTILWVITTLVVAMLPQLLNMPIAVAVIAVVPLAWRFGAEWSGWKPLPALVRHGATAGGLAILFMSYGDLAGRRAAVSLLAVMLSLKMIECYRIRDARLVVSFSLFLCATQFLFAQGIVMPLYGGLTIILALVTLAQLQRSEAWSHEGPAPAVRASILSELGFSLRLMALAVPIGLAFFMLFPRLASPLWGIPETTLDSKTGLSDSMSPGSIQDLFMDDSPAFRVEFSGSPPRPGNCIGVVRYSGILTGGPGRAASTARISRLKRSRHRRGIRWSTRYSSNLMNENGCLHWTTRSMPRRIPA